MLTLVVSIFVFRDPLPPKPGGPAENICLRIG